MHTRLISLSLLLLLSAAPALADGPPPASTVYAPPPPAPIWAGVYFIGLGGGVTGSIHGPLSHDDPLNPGPPPAPNFSADLKGGHAGGFALGYNWQAPGSMLVYGLEANMNWVGASGATAVSDGTNTWYLEPTIYSLGTLTGRVGIGMGPVLLYGSGGVAWALARTQNYVYCTGCVAAPLSEGVGKASHLGLIGGGGVEFMLGQYVVIRGEYLAASLGTGKHQFTGTTADPMHAPSTTYDWDGAKPDLSFQLWRVGVGLKFN